VNTVEVGDAFEKEVFETLAVELQSGNLPVRPEHSKLIARPAYFSRDREKDIILTLLSRHIGQAPQRLFFASSLNARSTTAPSQ
jgi:hypothetical protein